MQFDLKQFKRSGGHVHFIGCAGAGTQPLASIFLDLHFPCSGSDLLENGQTEKLRKRGMKVYSGHKAEHLPEKEVPLLVIYTSAAANDNPELIEARKHGVPVMRRGEALAHLGTLFEHTIAVAGSHGKTSVTSLIAHTLKALGCEPGYLIGGSVTGWTISGTAGNGKLFITEVDESDSTNALFQAEIAVVTNVEDDHSWSVGGVKPLFDSFVSFAEKSGHLVFVAGKNPEELFQPFAPKATPLDASALPQWDFPANWGGFQKLNAYTAFNAVKYFLNGTVSDAEIRNAVMTFPGVERRMSMRFDNGTYKIIEDYAHHPTELQASLQALQETNPGRRLVVLFQPHRFARLKKYINEFAALFTKYGDVVIIPPVFAAWTDTSDTDSHSLAEMIGSKAHAWDDNWEGVAAKMISLLSPGDLIAVIGAGDVKDVIPFLISKLSNN